MVVHELGLEGERVTLCTQEQEEKALQGWISKDKGTDRTGLAAEDTERPLLHTAHLFLLTEVQDNVKVASSLQVPVKLRLTYEEERLWNLNPYGPYDLCKLWHSSLQFPASLTPSVNREQS